jgi:hypothetical protein
LNDAAHIAGRPDSTVPICLDRHNFATGKLSVDTATSVRGAGTRGRPRGVPQVLSAKELGKRWRFFPTYAEL